MQDYRHPGPVYGCDWRDENTLATGCEDGRIRIFNVSKQKKEPVIELKGNLSNLYFEKLNLFLEKCCFYIKFYVF